MIISNVGTIVLSLSNRSTISNFIDAPAVVVTASQVRILSISNTVSRLVSGTLADIVSPAPSDTVEGNRGFLKKHRMSRVAFLAIPTAILIFTYTWMIVGVREQADIWALRSVGPLLSSHRSAGSDHVRSDMRCTVLAQALRTDPPSPSCTSSTFRSFPLPLLTLLILPRIAHPSSPPSGASPI